jgi:hypothetical protein
MLGQQCYVRQDKIFMASECWESEKGEKEVKDRTYPRHRNAKNTAAIAREGLRGGAEDGDQLREVFIIDFFVTQTVCADCEQGGASEKFKELNQYHRYWLACATRRGRRYILNTQSSRCRCSYPKIW